MDLQGVAAGGGEGLAHAPVGAGIVAIGDIPHRRHIELDVEAAAAAQGHHGGCGAQIPVELVLDIGLHGRGAPQGHGGAGGASARNPLGIGMAGEHQDGGLRCQGLSADPVLGQGGPGAGETGGQAQGR